MRFAAIADIHGNSSALRAVLQDIDRQGVTHILNLGDSLSGPMDPVGTADLLIERDLLTVSGNHDRTLVDRPFEDMPLWEQWTHPHLSHEHLDWVRGLPAWCVWDDVFLCHGTPTNDSTNWLDVRDTRGFMTLARRDHIEHHLEGVAEPLVLCAHTHVPRVVRIGHQIIANPGSVGCPAYLDDRGDAPFIAETGMGDARYAVFEKAGQDWTTNLRSVPYDPTEMIARIRATEGADSWVEAIGTGWISPPE